jgi:hypothetical protein
MKPSEKNPAIDSMLTDVFGVDRQKSIRDNVCVDPPIGCGQPITDWSELEQNEYRISGLCGNCQRQVFSANYEED